MGKLLDYVLGGPTSPMAGDGLVYSSSTAKSSSKAPVKSLIVETTGHCGSPTSGTFPSPRSSSILSNAPHQREQSSPQPAESITRYARHRHAPNDVHRPDDSSTYMTNRRESVESSSNSADTFRTALEIPADGQALQAPKEVAWQEHDIPEELGLVKDGVPTEIRNIVQESLDEHQAIRASLLQAQPFLGRAQVEGLGISSADSDPTPAESSAMASARRSQVTTSSTSNPNAPTEPDSTSQAAPASEYHPEPPITINDQLLSTHAHQDMLPTFSLQSHMTDMEQRFINSKSQTKRTHRIFRILHGGKSKGDVTPESPKVEPAMSECTSCFDDIPDTDAVALPCTHKYCLPCFSQLVTTAIEHEINFPPKCCLSDVPNKTIRDNLPPVTKALFDQKALEYAVPVSNRYYCVSSTCGKWIDTRHAKRAHGAITCPHCRTKLCTMCRGPQHAANQDCPQDFGLDQTLEQAERAGWRRCYNCRAIVELNTGCRHITCKCRAQFCYTCGAQWMTCRCTEADQERRNAEVRARLQQFEADQRARQAEEKELRRAMVAVEAAERQLREEREAEEARMEEEAREIARREAERVQQVTEYFECVHRILERVRLQQETAIERRHERVWAEVDDMRVELDSPERVAERKAHVQSERDKISAKTEGSIKTLQRQHAASMIEMINRHRKHQDELLARSTGDENSDEILNAETLQELMPLQDLERASLKSQQAREIEKWKSREEDSLKAFDLKMLMVNLRQEEAGKIKQREQEVQDMIFADDKWTEVIFEERYLMLEEDEKKMVRNGGEAPAVPKPEPLVKQGKIAPALRLQTQQQQTATHQALTPMSVKEDSPMSIVGLLVKETGHKSTQVKRLSVPERWSRGNDDLKMKNRASGFVARW